MQDSEINSDFGNPQSAQYVERIMDHLLKSKPEQKMLIWQRLVTIMGIKDAGARNQILDNFTQKPKTDNMLGPTRFERPGRIAISYAPIIAHTFFTPAQREELLSAGVDQTKMDELFPVPRIGATIEQAMLGTRA